MRLISLELNNWRNFSSKKFLFKEAVVVEGENGTGKTNLLESIRFISVGKSFRATRMEEIISFQKNFCRLVLGAKDDGGEDLIAEVFYGQPVEGATFKERRLLVNGAKKSWLSFLGRLPTVIFLPTDTELILGSPVCRRRFLDGTLWQVSKEYYRACLEMIQILRERSAVLWRIKKQQADIGQLKPWSELLLDKSRVIQKHRADYLAYLNNQLNVSAENFSTRLKSEIIYQPNQEKVEEVNDKEIMFGQNIIGAHRDDFQILLNNRSARRFSSRGQARTLAMLLRIGEGAFLDQKLKEAPITLLDDILSELDQPTISTLLKLLRGQVIATATHSTPLLSDWQRILLS